MLVLLWLVKRERDESEELELEDAVPGRISQAEDGARAELEVEELRLALLPLMP